MEGNNNTTGDQNMDVNSLNTMGTLSEIVTENKPHKHYLIKFSNQSDILSWQPALDEFTVEIENNKCGKITGDALITSRKLHKSFIAEDETSALQLLLNLGKKHDTTGRIKIVRVEGEIQTVIFNRSSKVYR